MRPLGAVYWGVPFAEPATTKANSGSVVSMARVCGKGVPPLTFLAQVKAGATRKEVLIPKMKALWVAPSLVVELP